MIRPRCILTLTLLILLSTAASSALAITGTPSWKPRESLGMVDYFQQDGGDRMLAFDHHGNPGIAFGDFSDGSLQYARRVDGIGWIDVEIDPNYTSNPSLAYDRYERPAISYVYPFGGSAALRFAHFDGTNWNLETADPTDSAWTSLAFDVLGRPAIAYTDGSNFNLKYVLDTDGDFTFTDETTVDVTTAATSGFIPSLGFDHLNRPMIGYSDGSTGDVSFAIEEPGLGWVTSSVEAHPGGTAVVSLSIDPDTGFPAMAYAGGTPGLRYAAWNGDDWDITAVDPNLSISARVGMAFDPSDGNPVISYGDFDDNELRFAWNNGSIWQTQVVDTGANFFQSSVAFNDFGNGFASIAYVSNFSELYFIEDPPLAVPESGSLTLVLLTAASALAGRRKDD